MNDTDFKGKVRKDFGSLVFGKLMLSKLIKWLEGGICAGWGVPRYEILMTLSLTEDNEPVVTVTDVQGNHKIVLTERLGGLEDIAKLMFGKFLKINRVAAEDWAIKDHEVITVMQLVDDRPQIRIINSITKEVEIL